MNGKQKNYESTCLPKLHYEVFISCYLFTSLGFIKIALYQIYIGE